MTAPLWALTTYFNPFRGALRARNYHRFRAHLKAPLLTVEWSPDGVFDLRPGDADILLQFSGGDILWQKERLLNLALPRVPAGCEAVAVLDGDILLASDDWVELTLRALQKSSMVQVFRTAHYLTQQASAQPPQMALHELSTEYQLPSMTLALESGQGLYRQWPDAALFWTAGESSLSGNPGLGAALRLDLLRRVGFYECNPVGAGDLVLMAAVCGRVDEMFAVRPYAPAHQAHIRQWAQRVRAAGLTSMATVPGDVYHLWHGLPADRRYAARLQMLAELDFYPRTHLEPTEQGPWRWADGADAQKRAVFDYLASRRDA